MSDEEKIESYVRESRQLADEVADLVKREPVHIGFVAVLIVACSLEIEGQPVSIEFLNKAVADIIKHRGEDKCTI